MFAAYGILIILLGWVCVGDIRERIIPNWLNGTIAVLGLSTWIVLGKDVWPDMAYHLGFALIVFLVFAVMHALGQMGGGDVKLLGALALWFPFVPMMRLLLIMALSGAIITLGMWLAHKMRKREGQPEIPYGVAIAIGGLWVITERNLNHFV